MSKVMGKRIREKRIEYGMSVEDLAKKLGVSRQTIYRWEKGEVKVPDRDYITRMAGWWHCEPNWLMHMEDADVTATYQAEGREPVTVRINNDPIMGAASLRAQLYQAAVDVKSENLKVAIELLKTLS